MSENQDRQIQHLQFIVPELVVEKKVQIDLLETLINENKYIDDEQVLLNQQLTKLTYISDYLLQQNKKLRQLYQQRTIDVQQIITTININLDIEYSEYQHKQHLLKQNSCLALKQIKQLSSFRNKLSKNIIMLKKQNIQIVKPKYQAQIQVLNQIMVNLKNNLNQNTIQKMQKKHHLIFQELNDVQLQTDNLVIQVNKLFTHNHGECLNLNKLKQQNQYNRIMFDEQTIKIIYNNKILQQQKKQLQIDAQNQFQLNQQMQKKYQQKKKKLFQLIKNKDTINLEYDKLTNSLNNLAKWQQRHQRSINTALTKHNQVKHNHQQYQTKIKHKSQIIKQLKQQHKKQMQQKRKQQKIKIQIIKNKLKQIKNQTQIQLLSINQQKETIENQIKFKQNQLNTLNQDVIQFTKIINNLQNPLAQIQKLQLVLKMDPQTNTFLQILSV